MKARMSPLQALAPAPRVTGSAVLGVFFATLALFGAIPAAHASSGEVADLMNHMRSAPSRCAAPAGLQHFVRRPELDRAAARALAGATLEESARSEGYQSVPVRGLTVSGGTDTRAMEALLASGYCPFIVDPSMVEMGIHQQGGRTAVILAGAFAPAAGLGDNAIATRVLALVNDARAHGRNCGGTYFPPARPVVFNEALTSAARGHAEDMARNNYFSHESRDGTSPSARVEQAGYDYRGTAENIAAGQMTPEAAMAAWITSPGHCANLMDASYTDMGVALASNRRSQLGAYWAQVFGEPMGARPARAVRAARR